MTDPQALVELADRLEAGKDEADTLRFSKCVVPGRKGYAWGAAISTNPKVLRVLSDCWNNRLVIASALRASANQGE